MCQLKKPRANEITEPLAFSVCKLELRGKAIDKCYSHIPGTHDLTVVNYGKNERKATYFVRTKTNQGASAATRVQGGTRFSHDQEKDKTKGKKRTSTKQKQTAEKVPRCSFKNARNVIRFVQ